MSMNVNIKLNIKLKLKDLLSVLPEFHYLQKGLHLEASAVKNLLEQEVSHLTQQSQNVEKSSLFVAIKGENKDAHDYLPEVAQRGALALVVENKEKVPTDYKGFVLVVENSRQALERLARHWYQEPSSQLHCFGVTGTNGKTSSTYMMEEILTAAQWPTGVIGTINHHLGEHIWPTGMTTPDPLDLQKRIWEMKEAGAKALAIEVSSHALAQHRADGIHFNCVLFTNLTRDHLDYHKNMNDYFKAKQRLFTDLLKNSNKVPTFAIVNTDDPWGRRLRVASTSAIWTYAHKDQSAHFKFKVLKMSYEGTEYELETPFGFYRSFIPLCGLHNVYNAVGVIAAAASLGLPIELSLLVLSRFKGVPGRLQKIQQNPTRQSKSLLHVYVDYAHTPDALKNVLTALQELRKTLKANNKIRLVFGCGGDRDPGKRPLMAKVSEELADKIIVTSDNPRKEDPLKIIEQITSGFSQKALAEKVHFESDRRKAIAFVLQNSSAGDVILIAGKGHEDYQILGSEKIHFSDVEVVNELLNSEQ